MDKKQVEDNLNKRESEYNFNQGLQYRYGIKEVKIDYPKSLSYFLKAADLGCKSPYMFLILWAIYYLGEGTDVNYKEAFKWCKKAADEGSFLAAYYLAVMYANGHGVAQDYVESYIWLLYYIRGNNLNEMDANNSEANKIYATLSVDDRLLVSKEASVRLKKIKEKLTSAN